MATLRPCEFPLSDSATECPNDTLRDALTRHNITLPDEQIAGLDRYCQVLWSWNGKLNLTRHTDYEKLVARDMADCLALEPFLEPNERILDVGTGGGVPGVVLAILRPDLVVSLCDSVAKKARAAQAIVDELGLKVTVHHAPVQTVLMEHEFNTLVVRAVAPLTKLLRWVAPTWDNFDRMLVIKGPAWIEERQEARHVGVLNKHLELRKAASYPLSGTESESVILSISPKEL